VEERERESQKLLVKLLKYKQLKLYISHILQNKTKTAGGGERERERERERESEITSCEVVEI
jgi:hypothetical protein